MMEHNKGKKQVMMADKPNNELARRELSESLTVVRAAQQRSGDSFLSAFNPVKRVARKKEAELLITDMDAAVEKLHQAHKADLASRREWFDNQLMRIRSDLRTEQTIFMEAKLREVTEEMAASGDKLSRIIDEGLAKAEEIVHEIPRKKQIERLIDCLEDHSAMSKRLRQRFQAIMAEEQS